MAKGSKYVADFDSGGAFLRSSARYLQRKDFPALGQPAALGPFAALVNRLPRRARESVYRLGGALEATAPSRLKALDSDELAAWAAELYPQRPYPAILIGSASGAIPHMCAALGMPWLPQTLFIPVKHRGVSPDDPAASLEAGKEPARYLLERNPDLQLHHMHDPNQDRLMLERMLYFRIKWRRLPGPYRDFIRRTLAPGGALIVSECERTWPTTQVGPRHVFQFGALGGATEEEVFTGGPRIGDYLRKHGVALERWRPPEPDARRAEAEWGFAAELRTDLERLAAEQGYALVRLRFAEPEDLSPFTADLYRWWYARRDLPANRLLAESFIIHEPFWTLRTGSVPFWMLFNMEGSAEQLDEYLRARPPFDEVNIMLFNHGIESPGLAPIERWRELLARGRKGGRFIGLDPDNYPLDFGSFGRYHRDLKRLPARYPLPAPLTLADLAAFTAQARAPYRAAWEGLSDAVARAPGAASAHRRAAGPAL